MGRAGTFVSDCLLCHWPGETDHYTILEGQSSQFQRLEEFGGM